MPESILLKATDLLIELVILPVAWFLWRLLTRVTQNEKDIAVLNQLADAAAKDRAALEARHTEAMKELLAELRSIRQDIVALASRRANDE